MYAHLLAKSWQGSLSPEPPAHARLWTHLRAAEAAAQSICDSVGQTLLANLGLPADVWDWRLRRALGLAALLHDLGKANSYFQGMVRAKATHPANAQPVRHELLGVLFLLRNTSGLADWLHDQLREEGTTEGDALFCTVIGAIAGHHLKMDTDWTQGFPAVTRGGGGTRLDILLGHENLRSLTHATPPLRDETWSLLPTAPTFPGRYSLMFRRRDADWRDFMRSHEDWRRFAAAVKALTQAADVAASALLPQGQALRAWIGDTLSNRCAAEALGRVVAERLKGQPLRPFQRAIGASRHRVTLAAAGCGTGKTVAAYLWAMHHARGRKLFFCYPTTGTATEGYLDYVHDSAVEAVLVHSRAGVDLEGITVSGDEDPQDALLRLDALDLWRPQAVVCTVDTVLALVRNNRRGLYGAPAILAGAFVFDEIHAYDDTLFAALVALIRALPGAPFLLMSASLPARRRAFLSQHLGEVGQVEPPTLLEAIPRYRLAPLTHGDQAYAAALAAMQRNERVLWVCNTVARAQAVYDRALAAGLPVMTYHSRFKYQDRVQRHRQVIAAFAATDAGACLAVTTQVAEMSLDLDAQLLITELASIPALIQRLGRLNRRVSEANPGVPREALVLEPEDHYPYAPADLEQARGWLDRLVAMGRPLSQCDLAAVFCDVDATQPEPLELRCEWLDSGWCARPGPVREPSPTVRLLLAEDVADCKSQHRELIKRTLTMPYQSRMAHWSKLGGVFLAPPAAIHYDPHRGAAWTN